MEMGQSDFEKSFSSPKNYTIIRKDLINLHTVNQNCFDNALSGGVKENKRMIELVLDNCDDLTVSKTQFKQVFESVKLSKMNRTIFDLFMAENEEEEEEEEEEVEEPNPKKLKTI